MILRSPYHTSQFRSIDDVRAFVSQEAKTLEEDKTRCQFCKITGVPKTVFEDLDENGIAGGRIFYDFQTQDLVVKLLPIAALENAHTNLMSGILNKLFVLGVPSDEICMLGATTNKGDSAARQGDSSFKPIPERRHESDRATLVIECGLSQSLPDLRAAANWWLSNTQGQVRVVMVVSVDLQNKCVFLEIWKMVLSAGTGAGAGTRARTSSPFPNAINSVTITCNRNAFTASGELRLDLYDIMLRYPVRGATQINFTPAELAQWVANVFRGLE